MLDDVLRHLRCPDCGAGLASAGPSLRCPRGHTFDIAREGYVSMPAGRSTRLRGDTAAMVAARAAFLEAGHYLPIARALAAAAERLPVAAVPGPVLDVGAGTGWYLARLLEALDGRAGIALDLSRPAIRRAARAHPAIGAVACDVRGPLPVATGAAALVLDVFAPRNAPEMRRALRRDGALLVVSPGPAHLGELVEALGLLAVDPDKPRRMAAALEPHFTLAARETCTFPLALGPADVAAAAGMGPSAWHADATASGERASALAETVSVTAAVEIATWRPR